MCMSMYILVQLIMQGKHETTAVLSICQHFAHSPVTGNVDKITCIEGKNVNIVLEQQVWE